MNLTTDLLRINQHVPVLINITWRVYEIELINILKNRIGHTQQAKTMEWKVWFWIGILRIAEGEEDQKVQKDSN